MRALSKTRLHDNVISKIERDLDRSVMSGASVLVAQGGEVLLEECCGYADFGVGKPLSKDSIFRLASMTKPVTAVAALIAVERGWFSLDDKISEHFPEFGNMYVGRVEDGAVVPDHKPKKDARIYNILSHTAGFMASGAACDIYEENIPLSAYRTNESIVYYCLKNTCLTAEPVSQVAYCGYHAYDLVALMIERSSGMKYADFLDKEIFEPLGMKDTAYHPTGDRWDRLVKMSDRAVSGTVSVDMGRHTFESFPLTYTCAGAGLVGTVRDYYAFCRMLLGKGEYLGNRILKSETFSLLSKPHVPIELMGDGAFSTWGLGVRVRLSDPVLPYGAYGWSGAYGTHFWVDPENEIAAIYMKNSRWYDSHGAGKTGREFERAVYSSLEN